MRYHRCLVPSTRFDIESRIFWFTEESFLVVGFITGSSPAPCIFFVEQLLSPCRETGVRGHLVHARILPTSRYDKGDKLKTVDLERAAATSTNKILHAAALTLRWSSILIRRRYNIWEWIYIGSDIMAIISVSLWSIDSPETDVIREEITQQCHVPYRSWMRVITLGNCRTMRPAGFNIALNTRRWKARKCHLEWLVSNDRSLLALDVLRFEEETNRRKRHPSCFPRTSFGLRESRSKVPVPNRAFNGCESDSPSPSPSPAEYSLLNITHRARGTRSLPQGTATYLVTRISGGSSSVLTLYPLAALLYSDWCTLFDTSVFLCGIRVPGDLVSRGNAEMEKRRRSRRVPLNNGRVSCEIHVQFTRLFNLRSALKLKVLLYLHTLRYGYKCKASRTRAQHWEEWRGELEKFDEKWSGAEILLLLSSYSFLHPNSVPEKTRLCIKILDYLHKPCLDIVLS